MGRGSEHDSPGISETSRKVKIKKETGAIAKYALSAATPRQASTLAARLIMLFAHRVRRPGMSPSDPNAISRYSVGMTALVSQATSHYSLRHSQVSADLPA